MDDFIRKLQKNMEQIGQRGVQVGGKALQLIDQRAAIFRLESRIRGAARQRRDLLMQIGKKVYALHKAGKVRNKDVLADCQAIDQLNEQIADLQAQVEALKRPDKNLQVELEDEETLTEEDEAAPPSAQAPEPEAPQQGEPTADQNAPAADNQEPSIPTWEPDPDQHQGDNS